MRGARADHPTESLVLGAAMLDETACVVAFGLLTPADFDNPYHATIAVAILALTARRESVELLAVADELRRMERLSTIGGIEFLSELQDCVATTAHIEAQARRLARLARARRIAAVAKQIEAAANDPDLDDEGLAARAEAALRAACETRADATLVSWADVMYEAGDHIIECASTGARALGETCGFTDIDRLLSGFHPGQLVIIAGRPGTGKTSLALDFAIGLAVKRSDADGRTREAAPVIFASLEMPSRELAYRRIAAAAQIDQTRLRNMELFDGETTKIVKAVDDARSVPLFVNKSTRVTPYELRAWATTLRRTSGLRAIFVDYLQLMTLGDAAPDSREREIADISRALKLIALELGVPVFALSQLNRKCEERTDKRPMLADLRESGAIEQDADVVMFIYRDELYNKESADRGIAEIIVGKQRNGPCDTVRLRFRAELTAFEEITADDPAASETPAAAGRRGARGAYRHGAADPTVDDADDL